MANTPTTDTLTWLRGAAAEGVPGAPDWLAELHTRGRKRFEQLRLPDPREEHFRRTPLAALLALRGEPAANPLGRDAVADLLARHGLADHVETLLVLVDGAYDAELSRTGGGIARPLADALGDALVRDHLGTAPRHQPEQFVALNEAALGQGSAILIPRAGVPGPIHLLHIATGAVPLIQSRHLIVASETSEATVVETYVGADGAAYLTNAVTEIHAAPGANLEHVKVQREGDAAVHISTTSAHQARDSQLHMHAAVLGAALARNDIQSVLDGEGAHCDINGLYLPTGEQVHDTHTRLEHAQPNCTSHELYKGVLADKATGVFNGCIVVHPGAQKTDAIQNNKALLLSDTATVDAQPQLEIYADDVRCTHGATVGQLDSDAIFYLRSRCLDEATARGVLTYAFANEVNELIRFDPVRERLADLIAERFDTTADHDIDAAADRSLR